jgi:multidrug efflux pump subunit AcrA (membrane-fusion protein)
VDRIADSSGTSIADISVSWSTPLPPVGGEAQATILLDRRDGALIAPIRSIRRDGNRSLVDVVDGATTQTVEVTIGMTGGDEVEILSGLREGQLVRIGF